VSLLRRIAWTALAGGLAAGVLLFALQAVWVTPLIQRAEGYESSSHAHGSAETPAANGPAASPAASAGSPAESWRRRGLTALADVLAAVAFALLLLAGMTLRGAAPTTLRGLQWGLAGYAAFVLAPSLGLPPELPGAAAAGLLERQVWWVGTVLATVLGLSLLALAPRWAKALGALALLVPHAIGAPRPPLDMPDLLPAALAAQYVAAVLVTSAVFWAALGSLCGWLLAQRR